MSAAPDIDWTDVDNARPVPISRNGRDDTGLDPHDHAAERAVLGALLLRPDLITERP